MTDTVRKKREQKGGQGVGAGLSGPVSRGIALHPTFTNITGRKN